MWDSIGRSISFPVGDADSSTKPLLYPASDSPPWQAYESAKNRVVLHGQLIQDSYRLIFTRYFKIVRSQESYDITTPSVKQSVKWRVKQQDPIGMHCDAPKWVPDPFLSVMASVKTSKLPLDARCVYTLRHYCQRFSISIQTLVSCLIITMENPSHFKKFNLKFK